MGTAPLTPPVGFQTCNVHTGDVQTSHLVAVATNGGTPGPTVCGLTRFDSAPGAGDADLPGWSMGGGVYGDTIDQVACGGCWPTEEETFSCRHCGVTFREEPFENCPARYGERPHTDLPDRASTRPFHSDDFGVFFDEFGRYGTYA